VSETDSARRENEDIAIEIQNKYHFYFLGLTFTVLALAVETAQFGNGVIADRLELGGWLLLLLSAIAGLSHMEWFSPLYRYFSMEAGLQKDIRDLKVVEARGGASIHNLQSDRLETSGENLDRAQKSLGKVKKVLERLKRSLLFKYRVMKYGFLAGVVCLMLSRGWVPLARILSPAWNVLTHGTAN
jgi:hypothetical protein